MVNVDRAVQKYQAGVEGLGGSDAYYSCGERGGWADVAECLHQLKVQRANTAQWAEKFRSGA